MAIDVQAIYDRQLQLCAGDTFAALRGTRTDVHALLQEQAGEAPLGATPRTTHAMQTAFFSDLWEAADDLVRAADCHPSTYAEQLAKPAGAMAVGGLDGVATSSGLGAKRAGDAAKKAVN